MKKYKEYMDNVRASDTLHQRLVELDASGKRPIPWKRYGTMAAALALVVGLGGFAAWAAHINSWADPIPRYLPGVQDTQPEIADEPVPDIALVEPGDVTEPGEKTLGGYDVTVGSGPAAMVTHYVLPYIEYGDTSGQATAADWDIPPGATRRDLTGDEIVRLMGGEDVISDHLDWDEYDLTGWAAWYEDGSFWGAYIDGLLGYYGGPANQFQFAVTAGQLPPTCFGYPDSVTQEIRGLTVTADKADREEHIFKWPTYVHERRVSFMKGEYGYRFEMSCGGSGETAEELASRLVRQIAARGLELSAIEGTIPEFVPDYDPTYEDGMPDHYSDCPYCADGTAHTHPYDPNGAADPYYNVLSTYVCDICGQSLPAGMEHSHAPGTYYTCPDCGVTVLDGTAHHHENDSDICSGYPTPDPAGSGDICGLPLAPGTHICEVCGQSLTEGVEHSHNEEHHSSHHGNHH